METSLDETSVTEISLNETEISLNETEISLNETEISYNNDENKLHILNNLKQEVQTNKTDNLLKILEIEEKTEPPDDDTKQKLNSSQNLELDLSAHSITVDDDGLWYFESDHLALRGNKDYSELLKTIVILEAIRKKALEDYEKVLEIHKEIQDDPMPVIKKVLAGESLGVPDMYKLPEVPKIDWKKYNIPDNVVKQIEDGGKQGKSDVNSPQKNSESNTFNRTWTSEEQKRLEELLIIYPSEPIEHRRFKKIAAALGNRTVKQVCSRVQKYFQKLHRAGLPIPGRIPKNLYDKRKSHKHQKHNHFLWKPSTFFPELDVPVVMDDKEVPGPSRQASPKPSETSSASLSQQNYLLPNNFHDGEEMENEKSEKEIRQDILRRVKQEKLRQWEGGVFHHIGYRCDYCGEDPIIGSRWHCKTCEWTSVDFCNDCMPSQLFSENPHAIRHKFSVITNENGSESSISSQSDEESSLDSD